MILIPTIDPFVFLLGFILGGIIYFFFGRKHYAISLIAFIFILAFFPIIVMNIPNMSLNVFGMLISIHILLFSLFSGALIPFILLGLPKILSRIKLKKVLKIGKDIKNIIKKRKKEVEKELEELKEEKKIESELREIERDIKKLEKEEIKSFKELDTILGEVKKRIVAVANILEKIIKRIRDGMRVRSIPDNVKKLMEESLNIIKNSVKEIILNKIDEGINKSFTKIIKIIKDVEKRIEHLEKEDEDINKVFKDMEKYIEDLRRRTDSFLEKIKRINKREIEIKKVFDRTIKELEKVMNMELKHREPLNKIKKDLNKLKKEIDLEKKVEEKIKKMEETIEKNFEERIKKYIERIDKIKLKSIRDCQRIFEIYLEAINEFRRTAYNLLMDAEKEIEDEEKLLNRTLDIIADIFRNEMAFYEELKKVYSLEERIDKKIEKILEDMYRDLEGMELPGEVINQLKNEISIFKTDIGFEEKNEQIIKNLEKLDTEILEEIYRIKRDMEHFRMIFIELYRRSMARINILVNEVNNIIRREYERLFATERRIFT